MSKSFAPRSGICVAELRMSSTGATSFVLLSLHGFFRHSKMHLWSSMNCLMAGQFLLSSHIFDSPRNPQERKRLPSGSFCQDSFSSSRHWYEPCECLPKNTGNVGGSILAFKKKST